MIGLGRMGANMTQRLLNGGHTVVVFDQNSEAVAAGASGGAVPAESTADLVSRLSAPRAVWVMLPAGAVTDAVIDELATGDLRLPRRARDGRTPDRHAQAPAQATGEPFRFPGMVQALDPVHRHRAA